MSGRLGAEPGQGCRLPQRRAQAERRQDGVPAVGQGRAGGRALVGQRVQQGRLFRKERGKYLHDQQPDRHEERRRVGHDSVRRQPRDHAELSAHAAGVELHGPPVSPAGGDPGRQLEVPRGPTGTLNQAIRTGCICRVTFICPQGTAEYRQQSASAKILRRGAAAGSSQHIDSSIHH